MGRSAVKREGRLNILLLVEELVIVIANERGRVTYGRAW